jgi:hypothetical protein
MAGLVPAIHVFPRTKKDVDARVKPAHDDQEGFRQRDGLVRGAEKSSPDSPALSQE